MRYGAKVTYLRVIRHTLDFFDHSITIKLKTFWLLRFQWSDCVLVCLNKFSLKWKEIYYPKYFDIMNVSETNTDSINKKIWSCWCSMKGFSKNKVSVKLIRNVDTYFFLYDWQQMLQIQNLKLTVDYHISHQMFVAQKLCPLASLYNCSP